MIILKSFVDSFSYNLWKSFNIPFLPFLDSIHFESNPISLKICSIFSLCFISISQISLIFGFKTFSCWLFLECIVDNSVKSCMVLSKSMNPV
ncbi:hypothetical protein M0811_02337 [Anaeramoeba ignava]|uniref:Uncharacterized protein n=1 Tax=Anaeramoeba ignava TaxID=1746090 RepID=A0A9Q0LC85_ANAIG|nr:hypothetical protein M0811_02337 [Anaeramoeba ignava]